MSTLTTFDKEAAEIKKSVLAQEKGGELPAGLLSASDIKKSVLVNMSQAVKQMEALRGSTNERRCIDMTMEMFIKQKFGFSSVDSFFGALGLNAGHNTLQSLMTMPEFDEGFRWLVPEVVREAVRLGLRKNPIYPNLIAGEESVTQKQITMPHVNMSDATPSLLNEAETIPVGTVSFGEKTVKLKKMGTGIKISDEVQKYVSLNIISLYLQDVGVKLGLGLDTMAIDCLINGEASDGSEAAAVVGGATAGTLAYVDMLKIWLRMGRLGRLPNAILSNEAMAVEMLQLAEFKGFEGQSTTQKINLKTPIPTMQDLYCHGAMPSTNKIMLVDSTSAMIKLNADALRVESERIVARQLNGTYATVTTGFATMFRDARLILDKSLLLSGAPFPTWMDVGAAENVIIN